MNFMSPLVPRNLSASLPSPVEEEDTDESDGEDLAEDFAGGGNESDGCKSDAKETEKEVVAEPRWKVCLRNRRLGDEFAAEADEEEAEKAAFISAAFISRPSAWRRPVFGSMWVRHPEHGLVRRSARIAACNIGKPE
jgi:hypothetical protein